MRHAARIVISVVIAYLLLISGHALAGAATGEDAIKRMDTGTREGGAAHSEEPCRLATSEEFQAIMDGPAQINLFSRRADIDDDRGEDSIVAGFFPPGVEPERGAAAARIPGARAANRVKSGTPVFPDLATSAGGTVQDTFALVRLTVIDENRFLIIDETSPSPLGTYKGASKLAEDAYIPLRLDTLQKGCVYNGELMNVYRGTPAKPLDPGEYALLYGENFYDFGVDP